MSKIFTRFKRFMKNKTEECKELLSSRRSRIIVGVVTVGSGFALIVSGYIPLPND